MPFAYSIIPGGYEYDDYIEPCLSKSPARFTTLHHDTHEYT